MLIPSPRELGFPEHITEWRPNQIHMIQGLRQDTKRVKARCAPTGSGKTAVIVTDTILSGKPTCIVTDSRAMQDQLQREYDGLGIVDLRGRSNYPCPHKLEDPGYTCEQGHHSGCPNKGKFSCPSSAAEMRAASSMIVVTNYDKWIHSRKYGQGLTHIQRVVFDEGHEAPNALARAMQIQLRSRAIESDIGVDFPSPHDALFMTTWKRWAVDARATCETELRDVRARLTNGRPTLIRYYIHIRNLARKLAVLSTCNPQNWVVEEMADGYQFDVISPGRYAEYALLLKVPEILVISATLRPKTLQMMGVSRDNYSFEEYESTFDKSRSPVTYIPQILPSGETLRCDSRADLSPLWACLDRLASARTDRNGLVHTVSYARRDAILAASHHRAAMFINEKGEPATDLVENFKAHYPGAILVSPSVGQGYDFAFKAAEWQLICKLPFPPPSKILEARTNLDAEYPHYITMQKLQQMAGRIMRAHTDQGETFIADGHIEWFMPRYAHLASQSFRNLLRRSDTLPTPPARLR